MASALAWKQRMGDAIIEEEKEGHHMIVGSEYGVQLRPQVSGFQPDPHVVHSVPDNITVNSNISYLRLQSQELALKEQQSDNTIPR